MAVIGGREAEAGTVAVRVRGTGKKQVVVARDTLLARLQEQVRSRTMELGVEGEG
jgi:threonyl-tRNA synthetase